MWLLLQVKNKIMCSKKKSGKIVETKKGLKGIIYNSDNTINDKVIVYLDSGVQMLCDPKTLKIIGYVD